MHAQSLRLCPPVCSHKDVSPPGSSDHAILQARILKWVAISSSRGSSWPRDKTHISYVSPIAGRFFTIWATKEAQCYVRVFKIQSLLICWTSLVAQMVKNLPVMWETWVQSLGQEDPLENRMSTHCSILAGNFHWQRTLADYCPWSCKECDMTEQLTHTHWFVTPLTLWSKIMPFRKRWIINPL